MIFWVIWAISLVCLFVMVLYDSGDPLTAFGSTVTVALITGMLGIYAELGQ